MTSREIAEMTGKEHKDVLRDVRVMFEQLDGGAGASKFASSYLSAQNKLLPEFRLPKRETLILVSGYSVTMRAKIIDRWQELEAQAAPSAPAVTTILAGALRLALAQAEALEAKDAQIAALQPAPTVGATVS